MFPKKFISSKKMGSEVEDSSLSIMNESTIECLNDDCLLYIFQYLTIDEKICIELVCKNWNRVVKISWNDIKSLELHSLLPYKSKNELDTSFQKMNTSYIVNILKRCQFYLNKIKIQSCYVKNLINKQVFDTIFEYCNNLKEVSLFENSTPIFFTEDDLKQLFNQNADISSVFLSHLEVTGRFLLNLDTSKIKELHLEYCNFKSSGCLYGFLGHLNNLNKLKIIDKPDKANAIIDALNFSNCKSIFEAQIDLKEFSFVDDLSLFLSKQKNMHKLKLTNVLIDQKFLESLPKDCFKELDLEFHLDDYEGPFMVVIINVSSFLENQKEIRKLILKNIIISEELIERQVNNSIASTLEELHLVFTDLQVEENHFNLSMFLNKQKKIRYLFLHNVVISKKLIEFQEISSLKENLEELYIGFEEEQENKELILNISIFLSKLKKIYKLRLLNILVDETFMQNLPTEYLEELDLDYIEKTESSENILKYLDRLQNLKVFEVLFVKLNDDHLRNITKFINIKIKKMSFKFSEYLSSDKQIPHFFRLQNLSSLHFEDIHKFYDIQTTTMVDIDDILKNLLHCKSLKYLKIVYCKFTSVGLNGISHLPNLSVFEVEFSNNTNEVFLDLIYKSLSLEELIISSSHEVTNELITKASKIKLDRGDSRVLKIIFTDCNGIDCKELKNLPLINVTHNF